MKEKAADNDKVVAAQEPDSQELDLELVAGGIEPPIITQGGG